MPLTILSPTETPPGGWIYRDPESDFVIKHNNLESLFNMATRHRSANGRELSEQEFLDNVCAHSRAGCADGNPPGLIAQAQNLIKEVGRWAADGFGFVSDAVLAQRRLICEGCEHWKGERGGSLHQMRCAKCGCRGIKLKLPTSKCPIDRWLAV